MNNVVQFRPGQVPAHIAASTGVALNANAQANLQPSFAVIGYKGRNWRLKYRGDETLLQSSPGNDHSGRPLPVVPVPTLPVIIVGIAAGISKQYYEKRYSEGDDAAPDCFSVNGVAPDPAAPKPQSSSCAVCPMNRFGSRVTDAGKKAKACQDSRRIAVVPDGDVANEAFGGPMLLRIPPMSLGNLDRYSRELERHGADISQVVTQIGFNYDVAYPEITFQAVGWIEDVIDYAAAQEAARSDQVHRMLEEEVIEAKGDAAEETSAAALAGGQPAHMQQPAPQPAAQPVAQPAAVVQQPAAQPAPQPAPQPAVQATVQQAAVQQPAAQPVKRASPFAAAAAQPQQPAQVQQPVPAAAVLEPTQNAAAPVVQGAPADMESVIDDLLK